MNVGSGDIVDRLSIVILKMERSDKPEKEYTAYKEAFRDLKIKYPQYNWDLFLDLAHKALSDKGNLITTW